MKRHSSWAVAAAILIKEEKCLHYTTITDRILQSDLTGLSEEGGRTPEQTVGAMLRHHDDVFQRDHLAGEGFYYVHDDDATQKHPKVKPALEALAETRK